MFIILSEFRGGESLYWGQMLLVRSVSFMALFFLGIYYILSFVDWSSELQFWWGILMAWADIQFAPFSGKTSYLFELIRSFLSGLEIGSCGSCHFLNDLSVHWFPFGLTTPWVPWDDQCLLIRFNTTVAYLTGQIASTFRLVLNLSGVFGL